MTAAWRLTAMAPWSVRRRASWRTRRSRRGRSFSGSWRRPARRDGVGTGAMLEGTGQGREERPAGQDSGGDREGREMPVKDESHTFSFRRESSTAARECQEEIPKDIYGYFSVFEIPVDIPGYLGVYTITARKLAQSADIFGLRMETAGLTAGAKFGR